MSDISGLEGNEVMTPATREIQPPEGVVLYDQGREVDGGFTYRFGLSGMFEGTVNVTVRGYTPVEGTFLKYEPGHINAHVTRRSISANEINRIGELSRNMEDSLRLEEYIKGVSQATQRTVDKLRLFGAATSESGLQEPTEVIDARSEATIVQETGIDTKTLGEKQAELDRKLEEMKQEAKQLGVALVQVDWGSRFVLAPKKTQD